MRGGFLRHLPENEKTRQYETHGRLDEVVCDRCGRRSAEVWLHVSGAGICQECTRREQETKR